MQDKKNLQVFETKSVLVLSDLSENVLYNDLEIFLENYKNSILFIDYKPKFDFLNKTNSATIIFKDSEEAEKARINLNMRKIDLMHVYILLLNNIQIILSNYKIKF